MLHRACKRDVSRISSRRPVLASEGQSVVPVDSDQPTAAYWRCGCVACFQRTSALMMMYIIKSRSTPPMR